MHSQPLYVQQLAASARRAAHHHLGRVIVQHDAQQRACAWCVLKKRGQISHNAPINRCGGWVCWASRSSWSRLLSSARGMGHSGSIDCMCVQARATNTLLWLCACVCMCVAVSCVAYVAVGLDDSHVAAQSRLRGAGLGRHDGASNMHLLTDGASARMVTGGLLGAGGEAVWMDQSMVTPANAVDITTMYTHDQNNMCDHEPTCQRTYQGRMPAMQSDQNCPSARPASRPATVHEA